MIKIETREQYLALFPTAAEAIEFEHQTLSVGREFLPPQAILVLNGVEPGPDYWQFLAEQLDGFRAS